MKKQFYVIWLLGFFCAGLPTHAQENSQAEYQYLLQLQKAKDKKLRNYRIAEHEHFLQAYPFSEKAPEILLALGDEWANAGNNYLALSNYIKLHYLYPEYAPQGGLDARVQLIIEKNQAFSKRKGKILELTSIPALKSRPQRYFQYLEVLIAFSLDDMKKMMVLLVDEASYFHTRFPDDARRDSLSVWLGDVYRRFGKTREAVSEYLKFEYLYKSSVFLPYARYQRGLLYLEKLKQPQKAIDILQIVVTEHKATSFGARAQLALGRVYEEKIKDYARAIEEYRKAANDFTDSTIAIIALEKVAKIQKKRMSAYAEAIDTYHTIIEKYAGQLDSPRMFIACAKLYLKELKDYTSAVTHYAEAADKFPADKNAPSYLLKAGEISERRLNDNRAALIFYQQVLEKFPNHKKAREAQKKIDKVEKKITPQEETSSQLEQ